LRNASSAPGTKEAIRETFPAAPGAKEAIRETFPAAPGTKEAIRETFPAAPGTTRVFGRLFKVYRSAGKLTRPEKMREEAQSTGRMPQE